MSPNVRALVQEMRRLWVSRFQAALRKERQKLAEPDEPDEHEEFDDSRDEEPADNTRFTFNKSTELQIVLMGHTIIALNTLRTVVFRVDDAGVAFLQACFVPSAYSLARSLQQSGPTPPPPGSQPTPAPFHFAQQSMPNLRGKVTWVPDMHSWRIEVHKAKSQESFDGLCLFKVSPELPPGLYADAKFGAYVKAIATWNAQDKSPRYRIPMPCQPSARTADSALASTGITGSQPTCGNASCNVLST